VKWLEQVQWELDTADAARSRGNEGMARVCARRAAGWTVKAYLGEQGVDLNTNSVLVHFRHLLEKQEHAELAPILEHMLKAKDKPDPTAESVWPVEIDLVAEAKQLFKVLFPDLHLNEKRAD
jgi:HEPN domain-containing protein